jgi:hypothetical protein
MYPLGANHSEGAFLKRELIKTAKWRQQKKKK